MELVKKCASLLISGFFLLALLITPMFLWSYPVFADTTGINKLRTGLPGVLDIAIKAKGYGGVVFGFVYGGKIVYTKSYGNGRSLTGQYNWASISKTLTALIIMRMQEQGLLDINDNIWQHTSNINDHPFSGNPMPIICDDGQSCANTPLTLKQVLCHRGGFYHVDNSNPIWQNSKLNLKNLKYG